MSIILLGLAAMSSFIHSSDSFPNSVIDYYQQKYQMIQSLPVVDPVVLKRVLENKRKRVLSLCSTLENEKLKKRKIRKIANYRLAEFKRELSQYENLYVNFHSFEQSIDLMKSSVMQFELNAVQAECRKVSESIRRILGLTI